ncbi:MAG TPA: glycoside hydrolase family 3 N-terminal domain-containing protein [Candidatus Limnocylindrales bacterium]|nr:glycoside hydrolase family 3 N-terminal domain-containing protein [Candidatus Limnocylindrales bacterium]
MSTPEAIARRDAISRREPISRREVSRRDLLRGLAAGSVAVGLAACGIEATPAPSPSATSSSPSGVPTPTASPTPSPSLTPEPETPAPTSDPATLRRKISRLLMVGFRGFSIGPNDPITKALEGGLGGVILFDRDRVTKTRNIESPEQLSALVAALREAATESLIVAIDQEGGRVARLKPAQGFPDTRSQAEIGATDDPDEAFEAGRSMAETMADAGIDLDLAPVVDVNVNPTNPAIGALDRSFSADPSVVAAMAEAEIHGFHEFGIRAAIKHFPGLGSARANTDLDHVDVTKTWTQAELEPFETLIAAGLPDAVMTGHMVNDKLDPGVPASLSAATVDGLLRTQLGWAGAVITDDLGGEAIASRYTRQEAVALALEAGNDLLLFANQSVYVPDLAADLVETVLGLVTSGRISEARIDQSIERLDVLAVGTAIE